jgi:hypothetical protein
MAQANEIRKSLVGQFEVVSWGLRKHGYCGSNIKRAHSASKCKYTLVGVECANIRLLSCVSLQVYCSAIKGSRLNIERRIVVDVASSASQYLDGPDFKASTGDPCCQ